MIINKYIFKKIEGVFSSFVFNHRRMLSLPQDPLLNCAWQEPFYSRFSFATSLFRMIVMVKPRRTFSFNFQSTLDSSVDDVPSLCCPMLFCSEIPLKIPQSFPSPVCKWLLSHSYSGTKIPFVIYHSKGNSSKT